uniref:Uncharacterized protein n=1 Tax=Arundo donax TaxID=35708 RepID=A0A0A9A8D8_ARUDO
MVEETLHVTRALGEQHELGSVQEEVGSVEVGETCMEVDANCLLEKENGVPSGLGKDGTGPTNAGLNSVPHGSRLEAFFRSDVKKGRRAKGYYKKVDRVPGVSVTSFQHQGDKKRHVDEIEGEVFVEQKRSRREGHEVEMEAVEEITKAEAGLLGQSRRDQ